MAQAPGHRLGQIIGEWLELALEPEFAGFCAMHGLYLDGKRPRRARPGVKVTWLDDLGNKHDLDYVIERGGTEDEIGIPAAFIETAWRRYTKQSKNKAQELEAAVLPVVAKWSHVKPFAGVMLAGEFSSTALEQLCSNGFTVQHIHYQTVVDVFASFDIDIYSREGTPDADLQLKVDRLEALSEGEKKSIGARLRDVASAEIKALMEALSSAILRRIDSVSILPLHGSETVVSTVKSAIELLVGYVPPQTPGALIRFEVVVRYDNGDRIVADFANAADAIDFLESFDSP
jgi:hypothetical protein